jgi:hypothetical protein
MYSGLATTKLGRVGLEVNGDGIGRSPIRGPLSHSCGRSAQPGTAARHDQSSARFRTSIPQSRIADAGRVN